LIIVDDVLGCEFLGKHTPAIALPEQFGYELQLIDDRTGAIADNTGAEHFSRHCCKFSFAAIASEAVLV
jgi:beta-glucosidase